MTRFTNLTLVLNPIARSRETPRINLFAEAIGWT